MLRMINPKGAQNLRGGAQNLRGRCAEFARYNMYYLYFFLIGVLLTFYLSGCTPSW